MSNNTSFFPLSSAAHSGWTPVSTGLPNCGSGRLFVGVNTAGYAGVFNDFVDIGGSLQCVYETAEDSVEILSDLSMWAVFHGPNATQAVQVEPVHADDAAVDALADKMKAKLAKQRAKGYGGWDTPECSQVRLSAMLREHVAKGDPVDVANFCAFLTARGEGIAPSPQLPEPAALPFAIFGEEMVAFRRFDECVRDGQGYDVRKPMMKRLAEIGLVRRVSADIYEHTTFGCSVLNGDFDTEPQAQPADALAEPVAQLIGVDEYGPRLNWFKHWVDLPKKALLYTAPHADALNAETPYQRDAEVQGALL